MQAALAVRRDEGSGRGSAAYKRGPRGSLACVREREADPDSSSPESGIRKEGRGSGAWLGRPGFGPVRSGVFFI